MMKKLFSFILIIGIIFCFSIPAFAADENSISVDSVKGTEQTIFNITRPEGNSEVVNIRSYAISGNTSNEDVTVEIRIKNGENYDPLRNADGQFSWKLGESGLFTTEVTLPNEINQILVIAYKGTNTYERQETLFTITYQGESMKDKLKKGWSDFTDRFRGIFK